MYIKRGRDQMRIRLKGKGIGNESVHDLLKLPIEVLYTEALREIGEQEVYIDELHYKTRLKLSKPKINVYA